jgi:hypothetical protein
MFKDNIPNQSKGYRDKEIHSREYIVQCERETLSPTIGSGEFSHQEIGVEEKDDERDFNHCSPERGESPTISVIRMHRKMILTTAQRLVCIAASLCAERYR